MPSGERIVSVEEAEQAGGAPIFQSRRGGYGSTGQGFGGRRNNYGSAGGQTVFASGKSERRIWLQFSDAGNYHSREQELLEAIADSDGNDDVVIFLKNTREMKVLPPNMRVNADESLTVKLQELFGAENVKTVKTR